MKPNYVLPELMARLPQWQLVEDCYLGQQAINARGETYLPNPSPAGEPAEVRGKRYQEYQKRAVYYNVVRRTAKALAGLVFAKYPTMSLPDEVLGKDVDGSGRDIVQQARAALSMLLLKGRGGLLADFPPNDGASKEQMKQRGLRPAIKLYSPESVINWRYISVGNHKKLSLVVIKESYLDHDDGFKAEYGEQLLVLRLIDNQATSEIYQLRNGIWASLGVTTITDTRGKPLDELPFTFFGSDDNDETLDDAPLYDLAVLNIAHYRNSADYEESNFITAQPSLFVTGVTQEWYDDVLRGNPILLGSRTANVLGSGSNAFLLQASSNGALYEAMKHKEAQMVALGAKLIEPSVGNKTATQVQSETADNTSTLATLANNLSDAYTRALGYCAKYVGASGDYVLTLNTRFETNKMTPQERTQLISEWQAGAISFSEMRAKLIEDEVAIEEDSEVAKATIESELQGYSD